MKTQKEIVEELLESTDEMIGAYGELKSLYDVRIMLEKEMQEILARDVHNKKELGT